MDPVIECGGFPESWSLGRLRRFARQFGKLRDVQLMADSDGPYAFLEYYTFEVADKARAGIDGTVIEGHELYAEITATQDPEAVVTYEVDSDGDSIPETPPPVVRKKKQSGKKADKRKGASGKKRKAEAAAAAAAAAIAEEQRAEKRRKRGKAEPAPRRKAEGADALQRFESEDDDDEEGFPPAARRRPQAAASRDSDRQEAARQKRLEEQKRQRQREKELARERERERDGDPQHGVLHLPEQRRHHRLPVLCGKLCPAEQHADSAHRDRGPAGRNRCPPAGPLHPAVSPAAARTGAAQHAADLHPPPPAFRPAAPTSAHLSTHYAAADGTACALCRPHARTAAPGLPSEDAYGLSHRHTPPVLRPCSRCTHDASLQHVQRVLSSRLG
eukprot:TRINITY_DN2511_c3_g1_i2.p1 TRINITY_DN2511_c3_g1~~TRINITY_DN2511_c3_g1_i2.p1  ORF type:complete len:388 (+),score=52.60 TRINITY_DN2511_c3_g1_i2:114-1277(+)